MKGMKSKPSRITRATTSSVVTRKFTGSKASFSTTWDNDYGMDAILADLEDMQKNTVITVGIHKDAKPYPDGKNVAFIGFVNENGSKDGHVPARPFLSSTFDENRTDWLAENEEVINDFICGVRSLPNGLKRLGSMMMLKVKEKIVKLKSPTNAAYTIKMKGFNDPLIGRTKRLLKSINYQVTGGKYGK